MIGAAVFLGFVAVNGGMAAAAYRHNRRYGGMRKDLGDGKR